MELGLERNRLGCTPMQARTLALQSRLQTVSIDLQDPLRRHWRRNLLPFTEGPVTEPIRRSLVLIGKLIDGIVQGIVQRNELIAAVLDQFYQTLKIVGIKLVGVQQESV